MYTYETTLAEVNIRGSEMSSNMLISLFSFLGVVFMGSMLAGIAMDKKVLKIISFVSIIFFYIAIFIVLWTNK